MALGDKALGTLDKTGRARAREIAATTREAHIPFETPYYLSARVRAARSGHNCKLVRHIRLLEANLHFVASCNKSMPVERVEGQRQSNTRALLTVQHVAVSRKRERPTACLYHGPTRREQAGNV
jgi:hypothetical protein